MDETENIKFIKKKVRDGNINKIMQVPKHYQDHENEYKQLLNDLQVPIDEDPTKVIKQENQNFNKQFIIDTFKSVSLFGIYNNFYNIEGPTIEETETLRYCKIVY